MIRPKNFKELRKSIVKDTEKINENSGFSYQNNINDGNQSSCLPERVSFKKIGSLGQAEPKYYLPIEKQQSFISPLKYKQSNQTMPCQADCFGSDMSDLRFTPTKNKKISEGDSSHKKMNKNSGGKSSFLQFDANIKKKVNVNSKVVGQNPKFIEERISSKKKEKLKNHNFAEVEPISFKSIIENSPQCNNTARTFGSKKKQPLAFTQKYNIQSQRVNNNQPERKTSLTKLKYQFNGIKKFISKNYEEISTQQPIRKEENEIIKESFLSPLKQRQKIITRKQSVECNNDLMTQQFRDVKINVEFKANHQIERNQKLKLNHDLHPYRHRNDDSQFDMVNMSRQSVCSRTNQLDMSPHF